MRSPLVNVSSSTQQISVQVCNRSLFRSPLLAVLILVILLCAACLATLALLGKAVCEKKAWMALPYLLCKLVVIALQVPGTVQCRLAIDCYYIDYFSSPF